MPQLGGLEIKMDDFETLKSNLPQHPGILGREKYFNSAVLVPFILVNGEYHLLFQKRAASIRQGGEICFPGGKFEPGIDLNFEGTAVREITEELGIDRSEITVVGQLDSIIAPMGATIDSFVGLLDKEVLDNLRIDKKEVEEVFTLPLSLFKDNPALEYHVRLEIQSSYKDRSGHEIILLPGKELGLPEKYHRSWRGKNHRVLVYKTDKGVIWGITAEIIHDLIKKISG